MTNIEKHQKMEQHCNTRSEVEKMNVEYENDDI